MIRQEAQRVRHAPHGVERVGAGGENAEGAAREGVHQTERRAELLATHQYRNQT